MRKIRIAQIGMEVHRHGWRVFESLKARSDLFDMAGYTPPEDEDAAHEVAIHHARSIDHEQKNGQTMVAPTRLVRIPT